MADNALPFELIARLEPTTHRPEEHKKLLERRRLPRFLSDHQQAALSYRPSDDLLLAINMALHTGSPLLLTGEPGTGKTQAATFVGAYFGIKVYPFVVKSTSTAQDLLYEFDAVGYLHWAQAAGATSSEGLGQSPDAIQAETPAVRLGFLHPRALWQAYDDPHDSVVLIDEIDKARAISPMICCTNWTSTASRIPLSIASRFAPSVVVRRLSSSPATRNAVCQMHFCGAVFSIALN
jgi:hypothetical protein